MLPSEARQLKELREENARQAHRARSALDVDVSGESRLFAVRHLSLPDGARHRLTGRHRAKIQTDWARDF